MTTALMHRGADLTVSDILLIELPHLSKEDREWALWEFTGYPCFFDDPNAIKQLRQQLRDFRNGLDYRFPLTPALPKEQP